jgi:hypothetical protein
MKKPSVNYADLHGILIINSGAFPALRAGNRAFRGSATAPATPPPQGRRVFALRANPYNPVARIKNAFSGFDFSEFAFRKVCILQTRLRGKFAFVFFVTLKCRSKTLVLEQSLIL